MKIKNLFLGILSFAALAFVSCEPEEVQQASISTDRNSVSFLADGGDEVILVTSTRDWTVTIDGANTDGISVSPTSGAASDAAVPVTISAEANEGQARTVTITFNAGQVSTTVTVRQEGMTATEYATLADVRAMISATDYNAKATIPSGTVVKAVVLTSPVALNNLTSKKNIYVQDETAGIQIRLTADVEDLAFGDEVEIDLSGNELSYYYESLQVNNLPNSAVTKMGTATVEPKTVSIEDFLAFKYDGQYVALENVQVAGSDLGKTWVVGGVNTSINMETSSGETFIVFSSKYSTFGGQTVPEGSGTICGVAMKHFENAQIGFAQTSDWEGLTGARFEGADYLNVTPTSKTVDETAGSFDITVDAKDATAWTVSTDADWITLGSASGTGAGTVTVNYTAGTGRTATVTFTAGDLTATCEVTQGAVDLEELTIAEFIAKPKGDTYYQLTGKIIEIQKADYGNIVIEDNTGSILIYGLTATKVEKNDKSFASLGLNLGDVVTLASRRDEYNGEPQGGGNTFPAYYISHEKGEFEYPELTHPLTSSIAWTIDNKGDKSYEQEATINGGETVKVLKLGTASVSGTSTLTIPAGTKKIGFYAVAWSGEKCPLTFSGTGVSATVEPEAASGLSGGEQPYNLVISDSDYYTVDVNADAEMTITVTTGSGEDNCRGAIFGLNAVNE